MDKIFDRAKEVVKSNGRVKVILGEVKEKIDQINHDADERTSFVYQLQVIIRMLKAHYSGEYRAFSVSTIFALVFALVYFITPMDLIPDFIPALGFTDDISLVYMVVRSAAEDISKFKDWENTD